MRLPTELKNDEHCQARPCFPATGIYNLVAILGVQSVQMRQRRRGLGCARHAQQGSGERAGIQTLTEEHCPSSAKADASVRRGSRTVLSAQNAKPWKALLLTVTARTNTSIRISRERQQCRHNHSNSRVSSQPIQQAAVAPGRPAAVGSQVQLRCYRAAPWCCRRPISQVRQSRDAAKLLLQRSSPLARSGHTLTVVGPSCPPRTASSTAGKTGLQLLVHVPCVRRPAILLPHTFGLLLVQPRAM
jgi:hypothetical protein